MLDEPQSAMHSDGSGKGISETAMYRPLIFREDRLDQLHGTIRSHPLATLVTYVAGGLTANFIPFTLANENGRDILRAHMARANGQIADLLTSAEALVIFQGLQAYITPSWYATKKEHEKVVPTWNYIVVQVRGNPRIVEDANWLRAQIDALTTLQEANRSAPWSVNDAPADYIDALLKNIVGFEIPIERIEGKWKVSQNQPAINRAGVVAGLREIDPALPMATIIDQQE